MTCHAFDPLGFRPILASGRCIHTPPPALSHFLTRLSRRVSMRPTVFGPVVVCQCCTVVVTVVVCSLVFVVFLSSSSFLFFGGAHAGGRGYRVPSGARAYDPNGFMDGIDRYFMIAVLRPATH